MDDKLKSDANAGQPNGTGGNQNPHFDQYKMKPPILNDGNNSSLEREEELRKWAQNSDPQMRRAAIDQLLKTTHFNMIDLQNWLMDPDADIRALVLDRVSYGMLHSICDGDKQCAIRLLLKVAHKYQDYYVGRVLLQLSSESEWLDIIWPEIEQVIDNGDPILMTMFICTYLMKVLPEHNWTSQDPHLQSWVNGQFPMRQYTLLKTAAWLTSGNIQLTELLSALTKSNDALIAENARAILAGKLSYSDF